MKSKKIGVVALLALAVAAPSAAEAAVRLKVSQGFGGDATQDYSDGITGSQDGDYTPTAFSAAYIGEQGGFVDFSYSTSADDTKWNSNVSEWDYERTDWALVGGISKNNVAFYAGWRNGEGVTTYTSGGEDTLSSQGLVFGLSGNFKPAPKHTITPSIGMGFLAGEWEDATDLVEFDWTFGFSYGLAYSFQASKNVALGLEFKGQNFSFEWVEDGTGPGYDLTVEESLQSTGAFVSFVF